MRPTSSCCFICCGAWRRPPCPTIPIPEYLVWAAWVGALIFALHPVAVYAVGYVVQRSILMATFFVLVMQLSYLHGLLTGRRRWLVLAAAAYFLAVFSKEHSVHGARRAGGGNPAVARANSRRHAAPCGWPGPHLPRSAC